MQRITISPDQTVSDTIHLTREQMHYLQRVLRLKVGDKFIAQDGQGQQWRGFGRAHQSDRPLRGRRR